MSETKLVRDFEYPSNSEKSKRAIVEDSIKEKKVEQIVTGQVIRQKKTLGQKFSETFFGDDTKSVGDYILHDVLIPAMKATLSDMVGGGIEMLLFGERRSRGSNIYRDRDRSYVSYNRISRTRDDREPIRINRSNRMDLDDIIIESRGEAEEVLDNLLELIQSYGVVSISDYYEMIGIESNFTDNKYGWTNLSEATVDRVRKGYCIRLPRPKEI